MTRHALISGASIAGLSAAFWLSQAGWQVRVVERAPEFRAGGQNVDVRGVARKVIDRMGLTNAVRARNTTERGTRFVDSAGRALAEFAHNGTDGPTAELEILRGDLAEVLRSAIAPSVEIEVGVVIDGVVERSTGIDVSWKSGGEDRFDLVVIAEGVRSSTRDRVFVHEVTKTPLHLAMVYGTIPRSPSDDRWWNWFVATGRRQVTTRPDPYDTTRATLAYMSHRDEFGDGGDLHETLRDRFDGAGWQAERVLDGFASSDDVYADYLTQIRMTRWSRGRIVVTGDAAWCVTPLGGGGCSLALTGAYVLAAFLSQTPDLPAEALARYEQWMRPVVDRAQKLPPGTPRSAYPKSRLGVAVLSGVIRLAGSRLLRGVVGKKMGQVVEDERALPDFRAAIGR